MLISTFELLLKPQFPAPSNLSPLPPLTPPIPMDLAALSRNVIQGYFLTIANLSPISTVLLNLKFTATVSAPITPMNFTDAVDTTAGSGNVILTSTFTANTASYKFKLPPLDTSLFILLPDFIKNPSFLSDANFEARGFVEVFAFGRYPGQLLVTAEQRGTFFKDLTAPAIDFGLDQIAYSVPVQNNGIVPVISFPLSKDPDVDLSEEAMVLTMVGS